MNILSKRFGFRLIFVVLVYFLFGIHWLQTISSQVGPYKVIFLGKMYRAINESSGLSMASDSTFWTHNDGNYPVLFEINKKGKLKRSIDISVEMTDFEEITMDEKGCLFIGDFGNNLSNRKNLVIYKFNVNSKKIEQKIQFRFPDQKDYSTWQKKPNFDCEAFFYFNDSLYLFSKNRSLNEPVRMYVLPSVQGNYIARVGDTATFKSPITAASINPSKTQFALLTYEYIYVFAVQEGIISFDYPIGAYYLGDAGQVEAICYANETDFLVSNEGGKMYLFRLNPTFKSR